MKKSVGFIDSDIDLINKIIEYQKINKLPSFTLAVRQLCENALEYEKTDMKKELFALRKVLGLSTNITNIK